MTMTETTPDVTDACRKFLEFISDKRLRDLWIETKTIKVYVRKSLRPKMYNVVGHPPRRSVQLEPCIDVATVDVPKQLQNKGVFKAFLSFVEEHCPYTQVLVESVSDAFIVQHLFVKRGYRPVLNGVYLSVDDCVDPITMVKRIGD